MIFLKPIIFLINLPALQSDLRMTRKGVYYKVDIFTHKVEKHMFKLKLEICRYSFTGLAKELPQLPQNRWNHACAALPSTGV